jgi:hypothetical protein
MLLGRICISLKNTGLKVNRIKAKGEGGAGSYLLD